MIRRSGTHAHSSYSESMRPSIDRSEESSYRNRRSDRLVIGPANHAGQAQEWCLAVIREFGIEAASIDSASAPSFRAQLRETATHTLPYHRLTPGVARRILAHKHVREATSIAIDGYLPLYGNPRTGDLIDDLKRFERQGQQVALIAHGSDVRDPILHMDRLAYSHFNSGNSEWRRTLERRASKNRKLAAQSGLPLMVSTPDLLIDLPQATWLPLAVRLELWKSSTLVLERRTPLVVHVPSARKPPIKGTELIHPVLVSLADEGLIEYFTSDLMPRKRLNAVVRDADIVVDQLLVGSYGVAAVEAMAAGRLVVGNIAPDVRDMIGFDVPIVNATPDSFGEVMRQILEDSGRYREIAAAGVRYVQSHHSGHQSSRVLADAFNWHTG